MTPRTCLTLAALFGFLAVLFGAFGAHGLSDSGYLENQFAEVKPKSVSGMQLPASYKYLQDFQTGVRYHMWHALTMFGLGILMLKFPSPVLNAAAWCFVGGIVLFSGSLYVMVICGPKFGGITWGMVAPIGGTLLLAGWAILTYRLATMSFDSSGP